MCVACSWFAVCALGKKRRRYRSVQGFAMVEVVMAVGVLAAALPLSFVMLGGALDARRQAQLAYMSEWVVPRCVGAFSVEDGMRVVAIASNGEMVGEVSESTYRNGVEELGGRKVRYLCWLEVEEGDGSVERLKPLKVCFEGPAKAPEYGRDRLKFYGWLR